MGRKMFPPSPMAVKMSIDSPLNAEHDILQIYHGGRAIELLSYRTLGAEASLSRRMPERALQFGDGNFLRGFVDDFIDQMNEKANFDSSVVIVPPASTGKTGRINLQDGLYQENHFCNTLVDRIVTGYPAAQASRLNAENGYEDALLDTAEPFGLWVIEGSEALSREFPARQAGLPVTASSLREVARLWLDRKSTRLNSSHSRASRMPSSA